MIGDKYGKIFHTYRDISAYIVFGNTKLIIVFSDL